MSIYRRNVHTGVSMGGTIERKVNCNRCVYFSKSKKRKKGKVKTVYKCAKGKEKPGGFVVCRQFKYKEKEPELGEYKKGKLQSDGSIKWEIDNK